MRRQITFPWLPVKAGRVARARGSVQVAPRMAPAAVRIPDPRLIQMPLRFVTNGPQIFVHEGARQALERRFEAAFPGPVQLAVTDNRRRMVTHTKVRGVLRVRLHMMFLDAPERVLDALVDYVVDDDRDASQLVGAYIDANSHRIRAWRPVPGPLRTRGQVHDLLALHAQLNDVYFGSSLSDLSITWGRRTSPRGNKRRTIKLGSYSAVERLVRLHPALDAEWVPRYFVSYVLYHEMVHHVVPPVRVGARTILHPPEFVRREREFKHFERAMAWEAKHITRLLRAR